MTMSNLLEDLKSARDCGVPLIAISTPDPWALIEQCVQELDHSDPKLSWECLNGYSPCTTAEDDPAWAVIAKADIMTSPNNPDKTANNPPGAIVTADRKFPDDVVVFVWLANRWLESAAFIQALLNCRDDFAARRKTVVLLGPSITLPSELIHDVLVLDDPLPEPDQLRSIVKDMESSVNEAGSEVKMSDSDYDLAVNATQGLAAFAAAQATALSFTHDALDTDKVWERKRQMIESAAGLSVYRGNEGRGEVAGLDVLVEYGELILNGKRPPQGVVFVDEIEKSMGDPEGDRSGVSTDLQGLMLSQMQDTGAIGLILVGPSGTGKSLTAKALANIGKVPCMIFDAGSMKGSLVGESEKKAREVFKVINSVTNGSALWIATSNDIDRLSPELKARFKLGTFFVDLPTAEAQQQIWDISMRKWEIEKQDLPVHANWNGREIDQCCEIAHRIDQQLKFAAQYVQPLYLSAPDQIQRIRTESDGKYMSASYPGLYRVDGEKTSGTSGKKKRKMKKKTWEK
jgi:hypothetical protein